MAINAIKEDIVKIENHCTKKIRLGYLMFGLDKQNMSSFVPQLFALLFLKKKKTPGQGEVLQGSRRSASGVKEKCIGFKGKSASGVKENCIGDQGKVLPQNVLYLAEGPSP